MSGPGAPGVVLVVEDTAAVRQLVAVVLTAAGYTVVEASDGPQALEMMAQADVAAGIGLVITDYVMPKMTGAELAVELRRRHPELPIVITSGRAVSGAAELRADPAVRFLPKPFDTDELVASVRAFLG
jgi:CheY-like chemotaxis protein